MPEEAPDMFDPGNPGEPTIEPPVAAPIDPEVLGFGAGDMPAELNQFNWGALLLPLIWSVAYGVWPVFMLWMAGFITPYILVSLIGLGGQAAVASAAVGITVVAQFIGTAISLYVGMNATRMLWRKEQIRLELVPGASPRFSVAKFMARQQLWRTFGIAVLGMSVAGLGIIGLSTGETAQQVREQMQVSQLDAGLAFVWVAAEIILGLWLAAQMRKEARPQ